MHATTEVSRCQRRAVGGNEGGIRVPIGAIAASFGTFKRAGACRRGTSAAFPRCGKRLREEGDPVWWGSQTSTGATPESVWKWRAPSTTRVRAQACCRWRRCGFAWPTGCRPTQKTNPIRSKVEVPLARSRPRALTMPAPSRAGCGGGARSRPVRPGAGIPRQSCDIVRTGPFVVTTRPSAHAFRMHASHAARNRHRRRWICRVPLRLITPATPPGSANSSAAPADSGFHPCTRTPRC